jgi:7,8-dihydropterin-6-yl-methyl-4-(beta-D-ribofuranosyl)aminobenzene 5'-phosphate synthase
LQDLSSRRSTVVLHQTAGREQPRRPERQPQLKDTFKVENVAPGHCTGEPTFATLKQAFGNRYIYAGVGTSLSVGPSMGTGGRRGEGPALEGNEPNYRRFARNEDPFGLLQARNLRSQLSHR